MSNTTPVFVQELQLFGNVGNEFLSNPERVRIWAQQTENTGAHAHHKVARVVRAAFFSEGKWIIQFEAK
jgi:lysozyme family protein